MKTSARNCFAGSVSRVTQGAVNDEVELTLPGGQGIVAIITRASSEALGLKEGAKAFALVKASSVIILTDTSGARFSARNLLAGTVAQVREGAVNAEVDIELPGGDTVVAIITMESQRHHRRAGLKTRPQPPSAKRNGGSSGKIEKMNVQKSDLPFGSEFSPSQVQLPRLLELARTHWMRCAMPLKPEAYIFQEAANTPA